MDKVWGVVLDIQEHQLSFSEANPMYDLTTPQQGQAKMGIGSLRNTNEQGDNYHSLWKKLETVKNLPLRWIIEK